jgi:CDP-glucose 4,6-dehydratase
MIETFWKGKKVFITGHTGFKGSWLALWLNKMNAEVTGYSIEPPSNPNLFTLINLEKHIKSINGNINDREKLKVALQESEAEIVFHLAAQSLVKKSYINPIETYEINIMGTVNLFEAVRSSKTVKAVVNITSDKCYENKEWLWGYREKDPMGGYDPYSSSKGCAELITSAYRDSFFKNEGVVLASARAGNVFGGGDWAENRLIPDIIRAILSDQKIIIRNPNATRPWQHVLEPLRGYLMLAQLLYNNPEYAQGWNFGPDDTVIISVKQLTQKIIEVWGQDISLEIDKNYNPHEAQYLKLDCSLAKQKLNWKPILKLDDSIEMTVEWYKAYKNNCNLEEITLDQIKQYEKSIWRSYERKKMSILQ